MNLFTHTHTNREGITGKVSTPHRQKTDKSNAGNFFIYIVFMKIEVPLYL